MRHVHQAVQVHGQHVVHLVHRAVVGALLLDVHPHLHAEALKQGGKAVQALQPRFLRQHAVQLEQGAVVILQFGDFVEHRVAQCRHLHGVQAVAVGGDVVAHAVHLQLGGRALSAVHHPVVHRLSHGVDLLALNRIHGQLQQAGIGGHVLLGEELHQLGVVTARCRE